MSANEPEPPTGSAKAPSARTLIGLVVAREREADERQDRVVGALLEQQRSLQTWLVRIVVLAVVGAFAAVGVKLALGAIAAEPAGAAKFDARNMQEGEP